MATKEFPALRAELARLGYKPERIERLVEGAGTRVSGDMHGMTVRRADGREEYLFGPFTSVKATEADGSVSAVVVRWG